MIIELYNKDNNKISSKKFESRAFYNVIPTFLAFKYNIIKLEDSYFENSKEGYERRLNYAVSSDIVKKLLNIEIDYYERYLLNLTQNDYNEITDVGNFYDAINTQKMGNAEDIKDFLEENEDALYDVVRIVIKKD